MHGCVGSMQNTKRDSMLQKDQIQYLQVGSNMLRTHVSGLPMLTCTLVCSVPVLFGGGRQNLLIFVLQKMTSLCFDKNLTNLTSLLIFSWSEKSLQYAV